jgi:hypothetical protein
MPKRELKLDASGDHPAFPCGVKVKSLLANAPETLAFVGWTKREHAALLFVAAMHEDYPNFEASLDAAFARADAFLARCDLE